MRQKPLRGWRLCASWLIGLILSVAAQTQAQESISSDRPGIGSGSTVLQKHILQFEGGLAFAASDAADQFNLGQLLARYGFGAFEVQALINSFVVQDAAGADNEGFQDFGVGVKIPLLRDESTPLRLSLLATVSFPTGADFLTSDETIPTFTLLADYPLSGNFTLSSNAAYSAGIGNSNDVFLFTFTPGFSLPGSDNWSAYFGYAGFFSAGPDQNFLEGGFAWVVHKNLQLDLNSGVVLDSGDYFVGIGLAARWPDL